MKNVITKEIFINKLRSLILKKILKRSWDIKLTTSSNLLCYYYNNSNISNYAIRFKAI